MRDYSRLDSTLFAQARVAGLRAAIVGAGALGNEVIKNLALMGVGHLDIVDPDVIEASNLTRSVLFCTPDIDDAIAARTPKAIFAARRAREINPHITAQAHCVEVADLGASILRRAALVFCCVDNEMARLELGWLCARLDRPVVDGGLGLINPSSGLVSVFPGAQGPCYACRRSASRRRALLTELHGLEDPCSAKERRQAAAGVFPTTSVMASIVGAVQVEVGLRNVLGDSAAVSATQGWSVRVALHPKASLETFSFARSGSCPLHAPESVVRDVTERPDRVSAAWTAAEMLVELAPDAYLQFDWPLTVRAACRACDHRWQPMVRRARFRGVPCPNCRAVDTVELETLAGLDRRSPWASRTLAELGLPAAHVHEVVMSNVPAALRHHVEVTGDRLTLGLDVAAW